MLSYALAGVLDVLKANHFVAKVRMKRVACARHVASFWIVPVNCGCERDIQDSDELAPGS